MTYDLGGKTAFISGSTGGIGFAVAEGLAKSGASVVLNGRTPERVDEAVARLAKSQPEARVTGIAADLSTAEGCDKTLSALDSVDILVNNLGIYGPGDFFETGDATWQSYFDTNIMSAVRLSRALAPQMQEKGWGRIVFLSSESAVNIPDDMIHYGLTKTALLALSRGLAKRLRETGVTVNAVLPGPTTSEGFVEMIEQRSSETGESFDEAATAFVHEARPSSILGRPTTCEEVASMIAYACSPDASATTGAALRADGGVVETPF
ncbi:SDR family oxidoreductase [Oceanicola sp. D3]|uniref:SDR family NAD(P)-dependent oxidoreductase n=1 Tax=Oceanicola sp. D3 TaxID=2587163 RepID=UPI001120DB26|nr:SDR family oxidoreductase [Oceanicola sp. D3]QDC08249.1 SDR family oxidoreductase [Oceanicola sp. D3]